ncbi:TPA: hypothetical protein ACNIOJ_006230, partial [Pseudomonas aeruginosa]
GLPCGGNEKAQREGWARKFGVDGRRSTPAIHVVMSYRTTEGTTKPERTNNSLVKIAGCSFLHAKFLRLTQGNLRHLEVKFFLRPKSSILI